MRLLIVTQAVDLDDPVLGFFHRWIEEFAMYCESVHVICLKEGRHALPVHVTVHSLGKESGRSRIGYLFRFYRYIFSLRYEAVFVHMNPEYVVLGGVPWRLAGKRIGLWYVHRSTTLWLRIAAMLANILFTSAKESLRIASKKTVVLGHAIDVDLFAESRLAADPSRLRMVMIGRVAPIKNIETAIRSLAALREKGVQAELDIIGEPIMDRDHAYKERLLNDAVAFGVKEFVRLVGAVAHDEVPKRLASYDISINASPTGGIDKTVLESAMAGAIPFVSNNAFRELLADDAETLVFHEGDSADLAAKIERVVQGDMRALRSRLRERVRASSDIKDMIPRILNELYGTGR